jgi:hypothetical protein
MDEAHKIVTDISYREVFFATREFHFIGIPIVCLSASFPPSMLPVFTEITGLENLDVIRMRTALPNIRYQVVTRPKYDLFPTMVNFVTSAIQEYSKGDKCLIFCRSREATAKVAKEFDVLPYYAGLDTNAQTFADWVEGKSKVMVSTSLLGCGLDVPSIRHSVHFDVSHTYLDQYQEEGRTGRNGQIGHAITFVAENREPLQVTGVMDLGESLLVPWALDTNTCRRIPGGFFLDGVAEPCTTLPNAQYCDYCERTSAEEPPCMPRRMPQNPYATVAKLAKDSPQDIFAPASSHPKANALTTTSISTSRKRPNVPRPVMQPPPTIAQKTPMGTREPIFRNNHGSLSSIQDSSPVDSIVSPHYHSTDARSSTYWSAPRSSTPTPAPARSVQLLSTPLGETSLRNHSKDARPSAYRSTPKSSTPAPAPARSVQLLSTSLRNRNPATTPRKTLPPAGINIAIASGEYSDESTKRDSDISKITDALDRLRDGGSGINCSVCWGRGKDGWDEHMLFGCDDKVATRYDEDFKLWRKNSLQLPAGWCWKCGIPQVCFRHTLA